MRSAVGVRTSTDRARSNAEVQHGGTVKHGRIIEADSARHAVTELSGVLDVVDTGDVVGTAHQERVVVARIAVPGRRVGRRRLTEGETSELDEHHFNRDITTACGGEQVRIEAGSRADRVRRVARSEVVELEVGLTEGADNAVFGGGTGINRQRHTGTGREVIAIAIALAQITRPGRTTVGGAVERGVDAQITTQLDAGVGARDIEETRAIQGADPDVLDRFGLDGKIGSLRSTQGDETRR